MCVSDFCPCVWSVAVTRLGMCDLQQNGVHQAYINYSLAIIFPIALMTFRIRICFSITVFAMLVQMFVPCKKGLQSVLALPSPISLSSTPSFISLCPSPYSTKEPPVALFSPAGNRPPPQFTFTSPRSPSPSLGPRPRSSSFTSPSAQPRPRTSSFTSPSAQPRPRTSSFTSPTTTTSTSPSSGGKSLSLRRPPPPAVVATTPRGGSKSDTLPSGRPRPPVNVSLRTLSCMAKCGTVFLFY